MDARQLMIGNIVDIIYDIYEDTTMIIHARVTGTSDTTIYVEFDKDGRHHERHLDPAGVFPALVTKEILVENGFIEKGEFLFYNDLISPAVKNEKISTGPWSVKVSYHIILVNFVHELQNLFFILSGRGLQMKGLINEKQAESPVDNGKTCTGISGQMGGRPWHPSDDGMKAYVGTKIIAAKPMSRPDYLCAYIPRHPRAARVDKADPRVLERYDKEQDVAGYLVRYPDGYESWSPVIVFEECYREISGTEKNLQR